MHEHKYKTITRHNKAAFPYFLFLFYHSLNWLALNSLLETPVFPHFLFSWWFYFRLKKIFFSDLKFLIEAIQLVVSPLPSTHLPINLHLNRDFRFLPASVHELSLLESTCILDSRYASLLRIFVPELFLHHYFSHLPISFPSPPSPMLDYIYHLSFFKKVLSLTLDPPPMNTPFLSS